MRSITVAITAAIGALALVWAGNASAQLAFQWSPQNTRTHLKGTLTFVPGTEGYGAQFQCKVDLEFHTGNIKKGADKLPIIRSATIKGKGCKNVSFHYLPWYVGAGDTQDGSLSQFGWSSGVEQCTNYPGAPFQVMADGRWYFDGNLYGCLTGYLTPNPPVSIVAVP